MDFPYALAALRRGERAARGAWPDLTFLVLVPGSTFPVEADRPIGKAAPHLVGMTAHYRPHLDLVQVRDRHLTSAPWTRSDEDLLASDWIVLPPPAADRAAVASVPDPQPDTTAPCACGHPREEHLRGIGACSSYNAVGLMCPCTHVEAAATRLPCRHDGIEVLSCATAEADPLDPAGPNLTTRMRCTRCRQTWEFSGTAFRPPPPEPACPPDARALTELVTQPTTPTGALTP